MANNENAYDRFRRNHSVKNKCLKAKTSFFIENHESSTIIHVDRTSDDLPAVLVFTDRDGADDAFVYVYEDADFSKGDYFSWKEDNHFFALEQVHVVKDVDFHKFKVLECNVLVNDNIWAYFKGPMTTFKNTTLKGNSYEETTATPLLVAPINSELKLNEYLTMNDQNWRIVDADRDTINGIGYYYIEKDLNSRNLESDMDKLEENGEAPTKTTVYIGQKLTLETDKGYIKADKNIKVLKRTSTTVEIQLLEVGPINVTVMRNEQQQTFTYTVKEV